MAEKVHANHGRDHLPHGADPIPGLAADRGMLLLGAVNVSVPDSTDTAITWSVDSNTLGATTADNITFNIPAMTSEGRFGILVQGNFENPAAGYTNPFTVELLGFAGPGNGGMRFLTSGDASGGRVAFAVPGVTYSSSSTSVTVWQNSGKTLTLDIEMHVWFDALDGF